MRRITSPFILRRLKTDKSIIADLPDKIEAKVFCNLTKEQASLYEAVVKEAEAAINAASGIERKGVVLATLLTGILLFSLGLARAGGAIRFIPYPVIGGFLSATGWLMVSGAVSVITDERLTLWTAPALFEPPTLGQLAAAGAVAVGLYMATAPATAS